MKLPTNIDEYLPRSILCLRHYNARTFLSDLIAGITVGLVALSLAMAFAIASGVSPQSGLYCAIVAGFLISALGGSQTQIGGPTGAQQNVCASVAEALNRASALLVEIQSAAPPVAVLRISGLRKKIRRRARSRLVTLPGPASPAEISLHSASFV